MGREKSGQKETSASRISAKDYETRKIYQCFARGENQERNGWLLEEMLENAYSEDENSTLLAMIDLAPLFARH